MIKERSEMQNGRVELDPPTVPAEEPGNDKPRPSGRKAVMWIVVAAVVVFAATKGWSAYRFGQAHVETDDAYITGDLVSISPTVSGTLAELKVQDGDFVRKGQLIARLNDDTARAELAQAKANARAAESGVPQAQSALRFAQLSTAAVIRSSQAAVASQSARTQGSRMQVRLSADTVQTQVSQAQEQVGAARATAAQARSGIDAARAGVLSARQAVETAERTAESAHAAVDAARAEATRSQEDLRRYKTLLSDDAISRQQYDTAAAAAATASAALDGAMRRASAADSEAAKARNEVTKAEAQVQEATHQAAAADNLIRVAEAGVRVAQAGRTQVGIQDANVQTNEGQASKARADVATAEAGTEEITLRATQIETARAQVEQARAAVARAEIQVQDAYLYAPCDGFVVKHAANVGTAISPGQTVVTITRGSRVWVMANFKETQLAGVREGQRAEVEVDAFPGRIFPGRVASILHATGAATTLLPPDNSTGNFTKVVQRVPVKIWLDPSPEVSRVRQGMSVQATITTAGVDGGR